MIAEFEATGQVIIYQGKQDYLDLIADNTAVGRTIHRVHTVHASGLGEQRCCPRHRGRAGRLP